MDLLLENKITSPCLQGKKSKTFAAEASTLINLIIDPVFNV